MPTLAWACLGPARGVKTMHYEVEQKSSRGGATISYCGLRGVNTMSYEVEQKFPAADLAAIECG